MVLTVCIYDKYEAAPKDGFTNLFTYLFTDLFANLFTNLLIQNKNIKKIKN